MKKLLLILCVLMPFLLWTQKNSNTIKIRKIQYDTVSYSERITDSISPYIFKDRSRTGKVKYPRYTGFLSDYVLIKGTKIYVFNKAISSKDKRKLSNKQSGEFFKKIKRLKRRNKIHYFKISYESKWIDSVNKEWENEYTVFDVYHDKEKIADAVKKTKVPDTETTKTNKKVFVKYKILNDSFLIPVPENGWTRSFNRSNLLLGLSSEVIFTDKKSIFTYRLTCPKSIGKNEYELVFDFKNSGNNQVTIIKNKTEEFICSYRVKGKYIYIDNPPTPEFAKGKIDSRISKIKYKVHSTNHTYTMKLN